MTPGGGYIQDQYVSFSSCSNEVSEDIIKTTTLTQGGVSNWDCGTDTASTYQRRVVIVDGDGEIIDDTVTNIQPTETGIWLGIAISETYMERDDTSEPGVFGCNSRNERFRSGSIRTWAFSDQDTETEALTRAEASMVTGTNCSARWEIRVESKTFIQRTSSYTIKLSKVRPNQDYRVTPEIRRREAYAGATDGAWEPVSVTPEDINFTAADPRWDEDEKTYTLDPVALPSVEGWEYQITGAEIEII